MHITKLTSIDDLNAFTADNDRALVIASRNNCSACVLLDHALTNDPRMAEAIDDGGYVVGTFKLETIPAAAAALALRAAPTTLVFHGDDEVGRIGSFLSTEGFLSSLKAIDTVEEV